MVSKTILYSSSFYWWNFGLSIINSVFVEGVIHDEEEDKKLNEIITRLDNIEKKLK